MALKPEIKQRFLQDVKSHSEIANNKEAEFILAECTRFADGEDVKLFFSNLNTVPHSNKVVAIIRKILADYHPSQKTQNPTYKSQSSEYIKLYYGVNGALSVFSGYGEIIASYGLYPIGDMQDAFFPKSNFSMGWGKDKGKPLEFYPFYQIADNGVRGLGSYNHLPDETNLGRVSWSKPNSTLMFYRNFLSQKDQILVVHSQPIYTQFPNQNREYDMFNWFLFKEKFNLDSTIPLGDLLSSLNLMKQYNKRESGMSPLFQALKNLSPDANPKLVQIMISTYYAGKRLVIDWSHFPHEKFYENKIFTEPESMEIFKALNQLPKEIAANYSIGINPRTAVQMILDLYEQIKVVDISFVSKNTFWGSLFGKEPVKEKVEGTKIQNIRQEITAPLNLVVIDVPFDKSKLGLKSELEEGKIVFVKWSDLFP